MNSRWRPERLIYVRYNIEYQDFDDEVGGDNDDYIVHRPVLGLGFKFGPQTEFRTEVGYFRQEFKEGKGADGLVLDAIFNTRREKALFQAESNTGYNLDYGTSENQGFSKYSDNSATISYQLAEALDIFASASYRWEDFTKDDRTDHTYGCRAGLNYRFREWLSLSLEGGHLRRDSNENDQEFTDNRITLRITTSYPIPFGN